MSKLVKLLLSLNSLKKELGFLNFFRSIGFNYHVLKNPKLNYKKVLILAPHPDDEVFSMAGTIVKLKKNGAEIAVCYFCDGSMGVPEEKEKQDLKNEELADLRKKEVFSAGKILKIDKQIFLNIKDGRLSSNESIVGTVKNLIDDFSPDIIFSPSLVDNHSDHNAACEILQKALVDGEGPEIWSYEVWTPLFPNRVLDISQEIEIKKRAIEEFSSQLASRGYDKAILGLNQYRAEINGINGYAEAFFALDVGKFKKLKVN